ncbi:MAG TPA: acyl carrier protein [Terriglobales bacterium]|nr:acyl carrier protein [Terriglobales bacterium]
MMLTIQDAIRGYIYQRYPAVKAKGLSNEDTLTGVLDSLAVLGLVGFIEPEFSIQLSPSDLTDENFETITSIARLVDRLKE